jgi:hypothetical protein
MLRKYIFLSVLTLGLLLQTSPVPLRAWELGPSGLVRADLAAGIVPVKPRTQADFNQNGRLERLQLAEGRLAILSGESPVWQSPDGWTVFQSNVTDLNQDGIPEAALLVWRPFRPWPVDRWLPHGGRILDFQDDQGDSCQIILIGWRGTGYGELWAGSAMAEPVRSFAVSDLNGDGSQELVTLEGSYSDARSAPARALKVWEWNGFGFSVVSGINGVFPEFALVRSKTDRILILVP